MKLLLSIFSFDTLKIRPWVPAGFVAGLVVFVALEAFARRLEREGAIKPSTIELTIDGYRRELIEKKPKVWLVGNSTAEYGIDAPLFSEITGLPSVKLAHGSATMRASAKLLEYYFRVAPTVPEAVILFSIKDDMNVNGVFPGMSSRYMTQEDWSVPALDRWLTLRACRLSITMKAEEWARSFFKSLRERVRGTEAGVPSETTPEANGDAPFKPSFSTEPIPPDHAWYSDMSRDYRLNVESIPAYAKVCREHGVKKVMLVLMPVTDLYANFHNGHFPEQPYDSLRKQVAEICAKENVILLDLADPSGNYGEFMDPYHLNPTGQKRITRLVAEWLLATE
ncbi:MAG: SGNH/GDSL hydrolase family protein [Planctomycetota bacterium]